MAVDVYCAADLIIICEPLCYLQNNFSKCSTQGLATAISGFYSVDEIEVAKCKLFETAKAVFTAGAQPLGGSEGPDPQLLLGPLQLFSWGSNLGGVRGFMIDNSLLTGTYLYRSSLAWIQLFGVFSHKSSNLFVCC